MMKLFAVTETDLKDFFYLLSVQLEAHDISLDYHSDDFTLDVVFDDWDFTFPLKSFFYDVTTKAKNHE